MVDPITLHKESDSDGWPQRPEENHNGEAAAWTVMVSPVNRTLFHFMVYIIQLPTPFDIAMYPLIFIYVLTLRLMSLTLSSSDSSTSRCSVTYVNWILHSWSDSQSTLSSFHSESQRPYPQFTQANVNVTGFALAPQRLTLESLFPALPTLQSDTMIPTSSIYYYRCYYSFNLENCSHSRMAFILGHKSWKGRMTTLSWRTYLSGISSPDLQYCSDEKSARLLEHEGGWTSRRRREGDRQL